MFRSIKTGFLKNDFYATINSISPQAKNFIQNVGKKILSKNKKEREKSLTSSKCLLKTFDNISNLNLK